jgi:hypothetical protein
MSAGAACVTGGLVRRAVGCVRNGIRARGLGASERLIHIIIVCFRQFLSCHVQPMWNYHFTLQMTKLQCTIIIKSVIFLLNSKSIIFICFLILGVREECHFCLISKCANITILFDFN